MDQRYATRWRKGFALVEVAVVITIFGVLAALGVPKLIKSAERSKASEAFAYLSAVRASQERYYACRGVYSSDVRSLDIVTPAPRSFTVGPMAVGATGSLRDSWTLTLTRTGAPVRYGNYTVIFTEEGFDHVNSTIATMPEINPSGS